MPRTASTSPCPPCRPARLTSLPTASGSCAASARRHTPGYVLEAAQATEIVLAAIARSDGTRASVLRELRATEVRDGLIGDFRFDRYGDVTPARFTVLRMTGDVPPAKRLPRLEDAVVDRVIEVPTD